MPLTDEQRAQGWIKHDGGGCPVEDNVAIYCMLRCGIMGWAMRHASAWQWDIQYDDRSQSSVIRPQPTDIIAYRPEPKQ